MAKLKMLKPRLAHIGSRVAAVSQQTDSWRASKQSSTQRGYGYKWQQARAGFLDKYPFCVFCLRDNNIVATSIEDIILECSVKGVAVPYASVVDHSIPHRGDMKVFWDRTKWQSLCAQHHSGEKQRIEARG